MHHRVVDLPLVCILVGGLYKIEFSEPRLWHLQWGVNNVWRPKNEDRLLLWWRLFDKPQHVLFKDAILKAPPPFVSIYTERAAYMIAV